MCVQKDKFIDKEQSLNLVRLSLTNAIKTQCPILHDKFLIINKYLLRKLKKLLDPQLLDMGIVVCMYIPNNAYAGGSALNQVMYFIFECNIKRKKKMGIFCFSKIIVRIMCFIRCCMFDIMCVCKDGFGFLVGQITDCRFNTDNE